MPLLRRSLPLAVLASLGLAACGGDDRLSKADYVEQGNAACREFAEAQNDLPEPDGIEDLPGLVDKTQKGFDTLIEDLEGLEPPEDLQSDHDKLLETAEYAKGKLGELKTAAEDKDEQKIQQISTDAEAKDKESDDLARKLGLTACADA